MMAKALRSLVAKIDDAEGNEAAAWRMHLEACARRLDEGSIP